MVFQSYAVWPHMTVRQNVVYPLKHRKIGRVEARRMVDEVLELVGLTEYAERPVVALSGGQMQRVALARSVVYRPQLLLLDEPLSNLDAKLRLEMRTEIRRVCKEFKLTTVYVTHDQKEALSISDRMAILESGHILQVGSPREVYKRPARKTVANFIGETDFLPGKVTGLIDSNVTVETSIGRFDGVLGDPKRPPAIGQAVTVSIRPECWELHRDPTNERNTVRGRIGDFVYLGEVAQYALIVGGSTLKIFERNPRFVNGASRGELFAAVEPEDVVVLVD
jgi:iron(III) transport system ATP-binding protein